MISINPEGLVVLIAVGALVLFLIIDALRHPEWGGED